MIIKARLKGKKSNHEFEQMMDHGLRFGGVGKLIGRIMDRDLWMDEAEFSCKVAFLIMFRYNSFSFDIDVSAKTDSLFLSNSFIGYAGLRMVSDWYEEVKILDMKLDK